MKNLAELRAEYDRIISTGSTPYQAFCQLEPEMGNFDTDDILNFPSQYNYGDDDDDE